MKNTVKENNWALTGAEQKIWHLDRRSLRLHWKVEKEYGKK